MVGVTSLKCVCGETSTRNCPIHAPIDQPRDESGYPGISNMTHKQTSLRPMDPKRMRHAYGGIEHASDGPVDDCLLCRLEAVAEAWFGWDQQALDALLNDYRKDDEE